MQFDTVNVLILLVVTFLVTEGLKGLSQLVGADLSGYGAAIVAGFVALLVGLFQSVLVPLIPPAFLPIVEPVAVLLVTILGAIGVHKTIKRFA